ncbi:MAG: PLP-dependent aminotransferase family protein, partial [Candidatus Bipolaricaulia bacterium]
EGDMLLRWCAIEGYLPLRRLLAAQMGLSPSEILITTGSQQGLYLLARALLAPGDFVVVEAPTYLGALQVFRAAGARLIGVPVDEEGMDLRMLENVLSRTPPKFIYTLPTFQNPAGATLGLKRRRRLLELAYRYRVPIVEDDPYSLLRYEGEALPPLKTLDTHGYVIYLSTFSKVLFPGLRVGWLAAPQRVIEHLSRMKQMIDIFTNSLAQAVIYQFRRRGLLEGHLELVRKEYRRRLDAMVEALKSHCPKIEFAVPEGGYFIWCRLERGVTARELLREALRERVSFLTGELFYPDGRGQEEIRLTFTSQPPDVIAEGIRRLGRAMRRLKREAVEEATEGTSVRPIV